MRLTAVVFLLALIAAITTSSARKTAADWAKFNNRKLAQLEEEERKELDKTLGNEIPTEKPGMVFATFGPGRTKEEKQLLSAKFYTQLQSAGVKVSIFESGEDQWVLATYRTFDTYDVVKYLREQPEVMKVTLDSDDWWHLPKYQKEYIAEKEKKKKEEAEKAEKEKAKKAKEEKERKEREAREKDSKESLDVDLDAKEL